MRTKLKLLLLFILIVININIMLNNSHYNSIKLSNTSNRVNILTKTIQSSDSRIKTFDATSSNDQYRITVAVDLSHGESDRYLDYIISNITFVNWVVIDGVNLSIDAHTLSDVDVLIIGQPTVGFTRDEMDAIYNWLLSGNKVLWVAADSDYSIGQEVQEYVNDLLGYIGAKLRIEYASFFDDYHNCGRFYRVLVHMAVDSYPELETSIISQNITKPILAHGPAPLLWVDDAGTPHDIVTETFPGLIRILWSYDTAYIVDNNIPPPVLYDPLVYGMGTGNHTFVFLAAEHWADVQDLIVVSGESPYGDYMPGFAWEYYGVQLDGPKYATNMIKWFDTLILQIWPTMETATTTLETTSSAISPVTSPPTTYKTTFSQTTTIMTPNETTFETVSVSNNFLTGTKTTTISYNNIFSSQISSSNLTSSIGSNSESSLFDNKFNINNNMIIAYLLALLFLGGLLRSFLIVKKRVKDANTVKKSYDKEVNEKEIMVTKFTDFPFSLTELFVPLERIGSGGMGIVWKVKDRSDNKIYALKIPNYESLRYVHGFGRDELEKLLLSEAVHWRDLGSHPNIARLFDFGFRPIPYLKIEYVPGITVDGRHLRSLRDLLEYYHEKGISGALYPGDLLRIGINIAKGLVHAHERGIAHFDIKPENILLDPETVVKITDWGIAKPTGIKGVSSLIGYSLGYSAPEMRAPETYKRIGVKPGLASDIYSFGMVLYELLTGKPPFHVLSEEEKYKTRTILENQLLELIEKMIDPDPRNRPTAIEVLQQLESIYKQYCNDMDCNGII